MAGKNKLSRAVRLTWGGQDLSGDLIPGSLNGPGFTAGEVDMTGESNAVGNFLADRKQSTVTARFHMNNTATTGASTVLNANIQVAGTLTVQFGEAGAAPTTGDPEWEGTYVQLSCDVVNDGGKLVHQVTWRPSGSTPPAWGTV